MKVVITNAGEAVLGPESIRGFFEELRRFPGLKITNVVTSGHPKFYWKERENWGPVRIDELVVSEENDNECTISFDLESGERTIEILIKYFKNSGLFSGLNFFIPETNQNWTIA